MFHDGPFELLGAPTAGVPGSTRVISALGAVAVARSVSTTRPVTFCPLLPSRHGTLDSIGTSPAKDEMGGAASAGATEPLGHSACCHRERRSARPVDSEEANRTRTRWRVFKHAAADRRGEHKIGTIQLRHRLDGIGGDESLRPARLLSSEPRLRSALQSYLQPGGSRRRAGWPGAEGTCSKWASGRL